MTPFSTVFFKDQFSPFFFLWEGLISPSFLKYSLPNIELLTVFFLLALWNVIPLPLAGLQSFWWEITRPLVSEELLVSCFFQNFLSLTRVNWAFYVCLIKFSKFSAIISWHSFLPLSLSSLLYTCWYACWYPTGLRLFVIPHPFFFLFLRLNNLNWSILKFADSFFHLPKSAVETLSEFFISAIMSFNSRIFF